MSCSSTVHQLIFKNWGDDNKYSIDNDLKKISIYDACNTVKPFHVDVERELLLPLL